MVDDVADRVLDGAGQDLILEDHGDELPLPVVGFFISRHG